MNIKRTTALIFSFILAFSLTACQKNNQIDTPQESSTTNTFPEVVTTVPDDNPTDADTAVLSSAISETSASTVDEENSVSETVTAETADDPACWSTEKIVEAYKNAAKKSHAGTKSQHSIVMKNISVNNGEHEGLFDFITKIMSKLLANNSEDKDGITGGYNNLSAADVASAKAYKSGRNTVIEMVMREQTSGANEDALSGSVGHAITAVGDISAVTKQLEDLGLPLEIPQESTKIHYTNPTVKVVISPDGKIANGTWQYTVEIRLSNYKAFGKPVDTTSVIMDNILTVNGGFKK